MKTFIILLFYLSLIVSLSAGAYLLYVRRNEPKRKALLVKHSGNDPGHIFYRYLYSHQGLNDYLLLCGSFALGSIAQMAKSISTVLGTLLSLTSLVLLLVSTNMIAKHRPRVTTSKRRKAKPKSSDWSNLS